MSHFPPHTSGPIVRQSPASLDPGFYYIIYLGRIAEADHNTTQGFLFAGNGGSARPYGPEGGSNFAKLALRLRVQAQTAAMNWTSWGGSFPSGPDHSQTSGFRAFVGSTQVVYETATINGTVIDKAWIDPSDDGEKWRKMEYVDWAGSSGTREYFISDDDGATWTKVATSRWLTKDGFFRSTGSLIAVSITGDLTATLTYDDPANRYTGSLDYAISGATESLDTNITLAESAGFPSPGSWAARHPGIWLSFRRDAATRVFVTESEQSYQAKRSKFRVELFLDPIPSTIGSHRITGRMVRRSIPKGLVEMKFDHYPADALPKADKALTRQGTVTLSDEVLHPVDDLGSLEDGDPSWAEVGFQFTRTGLSGASNTDRSYYRISVHGLNGPYTVTWDVETRESNVVISTQSFAETATHQGAWWRTSLRYLSSHIGLNQGKRVANITVKDADGATVPSSFAGEPHQPPIPLERWRIEYKHRRGWLGFKDFTQYGYGIAGSPIRYFRQRDVTYEIKDIYTFKTGQVPKLAEYPAPGYRRKITRQDTFTPDAAGYTSLIISEEAEFLPDNGAEPISLDTTLSPPTSPDSEAEIIDPTSMVIDRDTSTLDSAGRLFGLGYIASSGTGLAQSPGDEISSTWFDELATLQTIDGVDQIVTPVMETPFVGHHEMIRLEDVVIRPA